MLHLSNTLSQDQSTGRSLAADDYKLEPAGPWTWRPSWRPQHSAERMPADLGTTLSNRSAAAP
jgi:hypothetical protein